MSTARPLVRVEAGDDAVTTITIDRPERLNALSLPTITALKSGYRGNRAIIASTKTSVPFCARTRPKQPMA